MRTLDPHLAGSGRCSAEPQAPTWVVAWSGLDPWNIDSHDLTRLTLATHYRRVADVCGHGIYLHDGVRRSPAARTNRLLVVQVGPPPALRVDRSDLPRPAPPV